MHSFRDKIYNNKIYHNNINFFSIEENETLIHFHSIVMLNAKVYHFVQNTMGQWYRHINPSHKHCKTCGKNLGDNLSDQKSPIIHNQVSFCRKVQTSLVKSIQLTEHATHAIQISFSHHTTTKQSNSEY